MRRGRPRIRGLTPSPSARPSSVVSACPSPLPFVTPCRGCCARCAATPLNADCPFGHHRSSPLGHVRGGCPPHPLGASPSSVPVFFVLLPAVSRCSSLSLLLLPVVFIPSRRNERLPRRDARGPCPGRDAIPGQRFGAAPSFAVIAERHGGQSATPTRGPAHFARVRRMRLRSTTTTTGATTWRVGPSGMAPLPGWRRVLFRRDRRSVRRGPADGLRPASWSGTGPWPARVGGTGALRRNGDLFANSVRTCGPAGCWGSSPGRLYLFSPLPLPSPWSVLFPAPIPGGALEPKVRGRGFFCAGRHGEGQRLQGLRLLAASSGAGPDGPKRLTATTTSTEGVTWICSRCSVPWTRTSIDLARARAAFVAGHGPQVVAERRRPGPGVDPDATGGGHQVPPRRSAPAATGSAFTLVERPAPLLAAPRPSGPVS